MFINIVFFFKPHPIFSCPFWNIFQNLHPFIFSIHFICSWYFYKKSIPLFTALTKRDGLDGLSFIIPGLAFNLPAGMGFTAGLAYGLGASASTSWRLSLAETWMDGQLVVGRVVGWVGSWMVFWCFLLEYLYCGRVFFVWIYIGFMIWLPCRL